MFSVGILTSVHFYLQLLQKYIPYNTYPRSMHIPDLCFVLYHLTLTVALFINASFGKLKHMLR